MAVELSFQITGLSRVDARLARLRITQTRTRVAFRRAIEVFEDVERHQFASEGAYGTSSWAPLSPEYAAAKERAGYGGQPILQRTGELMESLTGDSDFAIRELTPWSATFGTAVPYADAHQYGVPGKLPARPWLPRASMFNERWLDVVKATLIGPMMSGVFAEGEGGEDAGA